MTYAVQPTLFGFDRGGPVTERYARWRDTDEGEAVYQHIRARALELRRRGWTHYGIRTLWETARYDASLRAGPAGKGLSLNNDYTAPMAREIMARVPDLRGFFEVRER